MSDDIISQVLEPLVDKHGLTHVLAGLSLLCSEKAEHIRANWQDRLTAKHWDQAADKIERAAKAVHSGI